MNDIPIDEYLIVRCRGDDDYFIFREFYEEALDKFGFSKDRESNKGGVKTVEYTSERVFDFFTALGEYSSPGRVPTDHDRNGYDEVEIKLDDNCIVVEEQTDRNSLVQAETLGKKEFGARMSTFKELLHSATVPDRDLPRLIAQLRNDWSDGEVDLTVNEFQELARHDRAICQATFDAGKFIRSIRERQQAQEKPSGLER